MTVTVPALVDFEHDGQSYRRGDPVTVPPVVASMLARLQRVSIEQGAVVAPPEAPAKRRRGRPRKYERRDLTAG